MRIDDAFPSWFFERDDPSPDDRFYRSPRLVTPPQRSAATPH